MITPVTTVYVDGGDEHRVPLGDITNTQNRSTAPKKRSRDLEDGEYCSTPCPHPKLSKTLIDHLSLLDVDLASVRRQKSNGTLCEYAAGEESST